MEHHFEVAPNRPEATLGGSALWMYDQLTPEERAKLFTAWFRQSDSAEVEHATFSDWDREEPLAA